MTPPSPLRPAQLLASAVLYLLAGLLSQALEDPASSVLYVWLPTGVAVAALLHTPKARWFIYALVFLGVELILRTLRGTAPLTLAGLSVAAVAGSLLAAWLTLRLAPQRHGLRFVGALILGAAAGAIVNAILNVLWITLTRGMPFLPVAIPWAIAVFAGTLIISPLILGWQHLRARRSGGPTRTDFALGATAFVALLASTLYLFDGDTAARFPGSVGFALTWLPLTLVVLIGLLWGPRGGSFSVLVLSLIVLVQTTQGDGPFASFETQRGESLLEAQIYLAAAAVLMLLLHTLRGARERALEESAAWRSRFELALAGSNQIMYQYDPYLDRLEWGGDVQSALGQPPTRLDTLDAMLQQVHPADRDRVRLAWAARSAGTPADQSALDYRINHGDGGWREVTDMGSSLADATGELAVFAGLCRLGPLHRES